MNDFNFIAPVYDLLKKMIFGKSLTVAEKYHLGEIESGDSLLILGGGTGKVLEFLPSGCKVTYLELSDKMISRARLRDFRGDIKFMHADFLELEPTGKYDLIIASFFLDVFNEEKLEFACHKIRSMLKPEGYLIVTDFDPNGNLIDKMLLKIMHLFFKLVSGLESNRLKDISGYLRNCGFRISKEKYFKSRNIFSNIFKLDGNLPD